MRHKIAYRKLNRTSEHRKALFINMLNSLIKYEQIKTTLPKAKVLKPQADKIITLGKKNSLQNIKTLVSKLQDIKSANKVKKTLSKRYEKRNRGYTRIIKAGYRYGDNAPVAIIEFVDRDVAAKRKYKKTKEDTKNKKQEEKQPSKKHIRIFTDSTYVKEGITVWINSWEKNNWKTADKKNVKNVDLWKKLKELIQSNRIEWNWVKGHSDDPMNDLADKLAKEFYDIVNSLS